MPETRIHRNVKTHGISPKVIRPLVGAVLVWLAARIGLNLDPNTAAAISAGIAAGVGYHAPPGKVKIRR